MNWQRADSTIFSPVPAGNWHNELPTQMLSSIGTLGFWNYYWQTGDKETIANVYDKIEKYLALWKLKDDGTIIIREGGWTWGDWGENKDMPLLFNTQYYMALDSYARMSTILGKDEIAEKVRDKMHRFKNDFNKLYWNGNAYRSPEYQGKTDDRSQGLAVVSGLADSDKYASILKVLKVEKHASPYMEKYILAALFQMGYSEYALERMKKRFGKMVNHPSITTMWEGWGIGKEGYGGGTTNHAWSGGCLTLLSQYVAGIAPTSAGYKTFSVKPQLGPLTIVAATVPTILGTIKISIQQEKALTIDLKVPENSSATVYIPPSSTHILRNGKHVKPTQKNGEQFITMQSGTHQIISQ